MISVKELENIGFKFIKESAYPFNEYYKKDRIGIDINQKRLYLIRYKDGESYADLKLPSNINELEHIINILSKL